jgi:hypothetical protein
VCVAGFAEEIILKSAGIPKMLCFAEIAGFVDIRRGPRAMQKKNCKHQRNFRDRSPKHPRVGDLEGRFGHRSSVLLHPRM